MNMPAEEIRSFMRNSAFPLSVQTVFVEDLSPLAGVPGATDTVALADTAASEDQAGFLADSLNMLANYHERQTPLAKKNFEGLGWVIHEKTSP
jgi:hypothetical protein